VQRPVDGAGGQAARFESIADAFSRKRTGETGGIADQQQAGGGAAFRDEIEA